MVSVRLYVTAGCDICRRAGDLLHAEGIAFETIDLDREPGRRPAGTTCAPAIEIDGKVRFRGEPNPVLLRRFFARPMDASADQSVESSAS
jgi:glutaredoxin